MRRFDDVRFLVDKLEEIKRKGGIQPLVSGDDGSRYKYAVKFTKPDNWSDSRFQRAVHVLHWSQVEGAHAQGRDDLTKRIMGTSIDKSERACRKTRKAGVKEQIVACNLEEKSDFSPDQYRQGIDIMEDYFKGWLKTVMNKAADTKSNVITLGRGTQPLMMNNPLACALSVRYPNRHDKTWCWSGDDTIDVDVNALKWNVGGKIPA